MGRAPEPPLSSRLARSRGFKDWGRGSACPRSRGDGPGPRQHPDPTQHCPTLGASKQWGLGGGPSVGAQVHLAHSWTLVGGALGLRAISGSQAKGRTPAAPGLGSKGCLPFHSQSPTRPCPELSTRHPPHLEAATHGAPRPVRLPPTPAGSAGLTDSPIPGHTGSPAGCDPNSLSHAGGYNLGEQGPAPTSGTQLAQSCCLDS